MMDNARNTVSKAVREKAKDALKELKNCPSWMFRLVKGLKLKEEDV